MEPRKSESANAAGASSSDRIIRPVTPAELKDPESAYNRAVKLTLRAIQYGELASEDIVMELREIIWENQCYKRREEEESGDMSAGFWIGVVLATVAFSAWLFLRHVNIDWRP